MPAELLPAKQLSLNLVEFGSRKVFAVRTLPSSFDKTVVVALLFFLGFIN